MNLTTTTKVNFCPRCNVFVQRWKQDADQRDVRWLSGWNCFPWTSDTLWIPWCVQRLCHHLFSYTFSINWIWIFKFGPTKLWPSINVWFHQTSQVFATSSRSRRRSLGSSAVRRPSRSHGPGRLLSASPPCRPVGAPSSAPSGLFLRLTASRGQKSDDHVTFVTNSLRAAANSDLS